MPLNMLYSPRSVGFDITPFDIPCSYRSKMSKYSFHNSMMIAMQQWLHQVNSVF